MKRNDQEQFEKIPLFAHQFLAGVPMTSLYRLELPGGPRGMTMMEIKQAVGFDTGELKVGTCTEFLFWVRGMVGRFFGWDDDDRLTVSVSWVSRLTKEARARSRIEPGRKEGISRVLYCFENEFTAEIVNRTVHCFWVMAKEPTSDGYTLYMAVYVRKLNWFTSIYMAVITPMLKWIIYPSLNKSVMKNWVTFSVPQTGRSVAVADKMI